MVLGATGFHLQSCLICSGVSLSVETSTTAQRYIKDTVLIDVVPFMQHCPGKIFQWDNTCPPHVAHTVQAVFHFSHSLNIFLIEHVWNLVVQRLVLPVSSNKLWTRIDASSWQHLPQVDNQNLFQPIAMHCRSFCCCTWGLHPLLMFSPPTYCVVLKMKFIVQITDGTMMMITFLRFIPLAPLFLGVAIFTYIIVITTWIFTLRNITRNYSVWLTDVNSLSEQWRLRIWTHNVVITTVLSIPMKQLKSSKIVSHLLRLDTIL